MKINFEITQLEKMNQGIILLNKDAEVTYYNFAARAWLQECVNLTDHFRALIKKEQGGLLTMPTKIKLAGDPESMVEAWLCKDGRWNYALFIAQPSPNQEFKAGETRFVALLGDQARREMRKLGDLLRAAANPGGLDSAAILQQTARVDQILVEIEQLSTLFQRDELFLENRLSPIALLKEVLPGLPRERNIQYKLIEKSDSLGVLYGDATWLKYAFHNLLSSLGKSAQPHSQIILELQQAGNFIVLNGRVQSASGLRPTDTGIRKYSLEQDIRLHICHRIVQLHGGHLKITPDEHNTGIESFVLNLLTGLPDHDRSRASCSDCRYVLQAQAFARDIATLMADD